MLLGALSAFGPLSMDMYLPGLPSMARDLSAPAWAAQLTITTSMLGLAGGQLVAGPISDALGRRRPLLAGRGRLRGGLAAVRASLPPIWLLLAFRLVQGMAGAAGIVIARAIVRDLHEGVEAARYFALLMLVGGLAPILAPLAGGALLHVTDWRGIFVVLAGIGAVLLVAAWVTLRETLAAERRHGGGLVATVHAFRGLVRDRPFMGYTLSAGFASRAMATYISGSPFVLQDIHGVSPQLFSVIFALQRASGSWPPASSAARSWAATGRARCSMPASGPARRVASQCSSRVVAGLGLAGLLPSLFVMVSSVGGCCPTRPRSPWPTTRAPPAARRRCSALTQFALGGLAAPLAGVGGSQTALPMAIVMATLPLAGLACLRFLAAGPSGARQVPLDAKEAAQRQG